MITPRIVGHGKRLALLDIPVFCMLRCLSLCLVDGHCRYREAYKGEIGYQSYVNQLYPFLWSIMGRGWENGKGKWREIEGTGNGIGKEESGGGRYENERGFGRQRRGKEEGRAGKRERRRDVRCSRWWEGMEKGN